MWTGRRAAQSLAIRFNGFSAIAMVESLCRQISSRQIPQDPLPLWQRIVGERGENDVS
ncbi:hypothetical protein LNO81_22855 [Klebsiella variicola subsp. variicola]|nr:hypothetical protein [Klebsiella variicola subsp. variicola]